MRTVTQTIYYADDGKIFEDKTLCEKYELDLKEKENQTTYWLVRHNPDLTEGRGYFSLTYLKVFMKVKYPSAETWVEDWCYRMFGRNLDFVQGVSPMIAWAIYPINKERFYKMEDGSIGSTVIKAKSLSLVVGEKTNGLVLE